MVFLDIAAGHGWETYGIEYNNEKKLADKKHIIFSQEIETLTNLKFDVVTMWDVFEHIKDGNTCLKKIKKKIKQKRACIYTNSKCILYCSKNTSRKNLMYLMALNMSICITLKISN